MKPAWTDDQLRAPHEAPDKAGRVRRMFNDIAPRYELVNTVCSAGRDARWRRDAVRLAEVTPDDDVLDVACGTGDFARAFAAAGPRRVVGCDFAHQMLIRAASARPSKPTPAVTHWVEADALCLPFADAAFSLVTCAFGVRNFQELSRGLSEMHRVLRPGGRAVILEFTRPGNGFIRRCYEFYAHRIMPRAATLISGDRSGAYRYLPRSVVSFPDAADMCARLQQAGFESATAHPRTLGVVTIYVATR